MKETNLVSKEVVLKEILGVLDPGIRPEIEVCIKALPTPEMICIDPEFFEHLLNCLANQKYINELKRKSQAVTQITIDEAWNEGMEILTKYKKDIEKESKV